jgi:hypothetical protein
MMWLQQNMKAMKPRKSSMRTMSWKPLLPPKTETDGGCGVEGVGNLIMS